jgi:hypothetical protein
LSLFRLEFPSDPGNRAVVIASAERQLVFIVASRDCRPALGPEEAKKVAHQGNPILRTGGRQNAGWEEQLIDRLLRAEAAKLAKGE